MQSEEHILTLNELISLNRKVRKNKKILVDLSGTKYNVIWNVMEKQFQWDCSEHSVEEWNLLWNDTYISDEQLRRMLPYQRINHFPGSQVIGRKNELGKNLRAMRKVHPEDYNFFPKTWLLPHQSEELRQYHLQNKSSKPAYIVKPEASCQGRGIFLTKKVDSLISDSSRYVVQEYLKNPLLIDGLKFDMRIYVLLRSVSPLKVFMYREGLGRLATKPYAKPSKKNMNNMCMHLTNYAINKRSKEFVFNQGDDTVGHKRSLSAILTQLRAMGHDTQKLLMDIRQVIVKTLCSVQPYLAHIYRSCQPRDDQHDQCFEIFGFDIILDDTLKPWLLEVNHTPSFATDTQLDFQIKSSLITDTLILVNIKNKLKKQYYEQKRAQVYVKPQKKTQEEREEFQKAVDRYEAKNLNGFYKIYPAPEDPTNYPTYMDSAEQLLDQWTGTAKNPAKRLATQQATQSITQQPTQQRKPSVPQRPPVRPMSSTINTTPRHQSTARTPASHHKPEQSFDIHSQSHRNILPLPKRTNRESFKIKQVLMVPVRNFNFQVQKE